MSDIRISLDQSPEPQKSIGKILLEFYDTMKSLEKDANRGGLQATQIVMTIADLEQIITKPPKVFIIRSEYLIIHGAFDSKEKAEKYINNHKSFAITEIEIK